MDIVALEFVKHNHEKRGLGKYLLNENIIAFII